MEEKRLEIRVIGVGGINIIRNGLATHIITNTAPNVKGGIISNGDYGMPYEDTKEMVLKRLDRYYPGKSKLIFPRYK